MGRELLLFLLWLNIKLRFLGYARLPSYSVLLTAETSLSNDPFLVLLPVLTPWMPEDLVCYLADFYGVGTAHVPAPQRANLASVINEDKRYVQPLPKV